MVLNLYKLENIYILFLSHIIMITFYVYTPTTVIFNSVKVIILKDILYTIANNNNYIIIIIIIKRYILVYHFQL